MLERVQRIAWSERLAAQFGQPEQEETKKLLEETQTIMK